MPSLRGDPLCLTWTRSSSPIPRGGPLCLALEEAVYAEPECLRGGILCQLSLKGGSAFYQAKKEIEGVVDFVEYLNICPDELFGL